MRFTQVLQRTRARACSVQRVRGCGGRAGGAGGARGRAGAALGCGPATARRSAALGSSAEELLQHRKLSLFRSLPLGLLLTLGLTSPSRVVHAAAEPPSGAALRLDTLPAVPPPSEKRPSPLAPSPLLAVGVWAATQLVPSPLLVVGVGHVGGGMRWQVTPLLYSFGIAERPVRAFFVAPIARHSGSVELHASPEWACCAPHDESGWLVRAGLRLYLPLLERGEKLSWSVGTSYYRAAGGGGAAADVGIYTLNGIIGLNVSVSPWLTQRGVITALTIRYF